MSDRSPIEWTDATWNPVRGCTKISSGCKNCYANRFAERFRGVAGHPFEQGFEQVDRLLGVHPELGRGPEGRAELQRYLGGHGTPTVDDSIHHLDVAAEAIGEPLLAHAEGDEELLAKDLSRGRRAAVAAGHRLNVLQRLP